MKEKVREMLETRRHTLEGIAKGQTWEPTFFVAGAAKAGTTSLHRYLGQHPEVFTTEEKEVHFFTRTLEEAQDPGMAWGDYLARFLPGRSAEHRGESTPGYLYEPEALARIKDTLGSDVRFIVSLRDPVERAHSDWAMRKAAGVETRPLAQALREEIEGERPADYVWRGLYDTHLGTLVGMFGREQVTVISFQRFSEHTDAVLRRILRDLGVEPTTEPIDTETVHNEGGEWISDRVRRLVQDPRVKAAARALLPKRTRVWLGEHLLWEKDAKPALSDEAREVGARFFEDRMERTEELVGVEMPELRRTWP